MIWDGVWQGCPWLLITWWCREENSSTSKIDLVHAEEYVDLTLNVDLTFIDILILDMHTYSKIP